MFCVRGQSLCSIMATQNPGLYLFNDTFDIKELNPHKKRFERVDRIVGESPLFQNEIVLDINCEVFRVKVGDSISVLITNSPYADGRADPKDFTQDLGPSLLDQYEYVMYGKVFKVEIGKMEHGKEPPVHIMASFGGLLMKLSGQQKHMATFAPDSNIYIMVRH